MNVIYSLNDSQLQDLHSLYQQEWWTKERSLQDTIKCIDGSQICIGTTDSNGNLLGFARVLTDYIFKALIFDLIISKDHRNNGLGDKIISLIKNDEKLQDVQHFELYCLPEIFGFYQKHGFSSDVGNIKLMRCTNA